ncbi:MAG: hypothetical protein R3C44_17590 [Chloroflexota bacterium]
MAECLAALAALGPETGQEDVATRLLAAAETQLTSSGAAWWPADRVEIEHTLTRLRESLGDDRFTTLWAQGATLTLPEAMQLAERIG